MARIWTLIWLLMAVGGLVLMAVSYRDARDSSLPVGERLILFVAEKPEATAEKGAPVIVSFLPPDATVKELVKAIDQIDSAQGRSFLRNHQEMVILFPDFNQRFTANMLASGRLPVPGTKEVLAEPHTALPDQIAVGDQALRIVGVLKKADSLHLDAFYAADDPAAREMLDPDEKLLISGFLVSREVLDKAQDMKKQFPQEQFTAVVGMQRMGRATFNSYVAGMLLFVLGGSALLIQGFLIAARRITNVWLGPPLVQISRYWKLFTLLHVVYFGIVGAGMLVIYEVPLIQDFLLGAVRGEIESKSGVLGVAGQAYGSGNIALAAVTTLVINFFAGSLLVITLPSVIVPGIGVFMALFRATLWGIVLAPASMTLAGGMLFHSGTLLLEGEGYIIATFFALLVPIYLFSPSEANNLRTRYGHALLMNIKGNILVFVVLAIAATYEAIEVILQMPR